MTDIHVNLYSVTAPSLSRIKPPGQFFYAPNDDGTDENLLILLHGLGLSGKIITVLFFRSRFDDDLRKPHRRHPHSISKSLKLPQTAILALCAPDQ